MNNEKHKRRLLYLEYLLLQEFYLNDDLKIDLDSNMIVGFTSGVTTIPSIMGIAQTLLNRGLITENGITDLGEKYLIKYPLPKVKYPKVYNMTVKDNNYLNILNDSSHNWTQSKHLVKKSSMLFKLVQAGYAIAKKSDSNNKISKNDVIPTPSIFVKQERTRYAFKITKKGKDYLSSLK